MTPRLFAPHALTATGWHRDVGIDVAADGTIAAIVPGADPVGRERLSGIVVPGMANLHSHAFQRLMAGLAEQPGPGADSFWTWREVMYRFLAALTPDDIEAVAAFLYAEMLEAGFTSVAEFHYVHHQPDGTPYANVAETSERIAAAAAASGIGLTLLPVHYAWGGVGRKPTGDGQRRFRTDLDLFARLYEAAGRAVRMLDGAALGVAPHSLRATDGSEFPRLIELSAGAPIHIHAAEQPREVAECRAGLGARPVAWLIANVPLDRRWCLIHATHTTPEELAALGPTGAVVAICPMTEGSLGDGLFHVPQYRAAGGRFGIGTDSHLTVDPAEELRMLEYGQRLRDGTRNVIADPGSGTSTGRTLVESCLASASDVLGRPVGGLGVGRRADLVVLDSAHPALVGRTGDSILDGWVFAAGRSAIREVRVGGRVLVREGRHVAREALLQAYRRVAARLVA